MLLLLLCCCCCYECTVVVIAVAVVILFLLLLLLLLLLFCSYCCSVAIAVAVAVVLSHLDLLPALLNSRSLAAFSSLAALTADALRSDSTSEKMRFGYARSELGDEEAHSDTMHALSRPPPPPRLLLAAALKQRVARDRSVKGGGSSES